MTKHEVTPGKYWYTRPSWSTLVRVEVVKIEGELYVKFREGYYPSTLNGCPDDAIFEVRDDSNSG